MAISGYCKTTARVLKKRMFDYFRIFNLKESRIGKSNRSMFLLISGLSLLTSISFGEVTFQTVDGQSSSGRANTTLTSISDGNVAGMDANGGWPSGKGFVVYNGQQYDVNVNWSSWSEMVGLRGSNVIMRAGGAGISFANGISRNLNWQTNPWSWETLGMWYDGGGRFIQDFSKSGTIITNYNDIGLFFDVNGNATQIRSENGWSTQLTGVWNNDVVGYSGNKGFIWRGGAFTDVFMPNSAWTQAHGISGEFVVGNYSTSSDGQVHGFLFDGSTYLTIDAPNAINTYLFDIDGTQAVGSYTTADGARHGLIVNGVPEPSALSLLAVGIGVVLRQRRRTV